MEELKKLLEEQRRAFEEFKGENDKGEKASKEKLAAIEKALSENEDKQAKLLAEQKKQLDEIERKVNRANLPGIEGGKDPEKLAEQKAARLAFIRHGETKALIKSDDTGGGYLAGEEMDAAIIKAAQLISPVRNLVTVRPISKQSIKSPKLTNSPAMAAKTGEVQTRTESTNPAYGLVDIPTHEFYAIHKVSHQQLEDSDYDIEAELAEFMGWQFGLREGNDVVKGTGNGEARGFTTTSAGVAFTVSGTAATIADAQGVADGIIDMVHAVKAEYARNGVFVLNRKTLGAVRKLKDTQKRYLWEPSVQAGLPPTIFSAPYVEISEMDDEGAGKFPIAFGDFKRAYRFHPRIQSSLLRDPYSLSDSGLVKFTSYRRHGGDVVLAEAIRLLKCST